MPVYLTLQLPRRTALVSPQGRWALTPPSHPYRDPGAGRLFSSALLYPRGQLSVRKWDALCCPDFPHAPCGTSGRPAYCLFWLQKYGKNVRYGNARGKEFVATAERIPRKERFGLPCFIDISLQYESKPDSLYQPPCSVVTSLFLRCVSTLSCMYFLFIKKPVSGVRVESHWNHTGVRVESWYPHS